jgi:hypothetical protein
VRRTGSSFATSENALTKIAAQPGGCAASARTSSSGRTLRGRRSETKGILIDALRFFEPFRASFHSSSCYNRLSRITPSGSDLARTNQPDCRWFCLYGAGEASGRVLADAQIMSIFRVLPS